MNGPFEAGDLLLRVCLNVKHLGVGGGGMHSAFHRAKKGQPCHFLMAVGGVCCGAKGHKGKET